MEYNNMKISKMFTYLLAISLMAILASCGLPDLEKDFAAKHKVTLDFLVSHISEESILGGFSGRMYAHKGNSLCNNNYHEVKGNYDAQKIYKKYNFNTEKACVLLDVESDDKMEAIYVVADDRKVYFHEYWN
jgi:hypothetical protein